MRQLIAYLKNRSGLRGKLRRRRLLFELYALLLVLLALYAWTSHLFVEN